MINTVALTGRLTRDPELRYTNSSIAVVQFILAVDRTFTNANGEKEADFIQIVAWRKTAELVANNTKKGTLIGVSGRVQTRNYQDNDGKTVYITEVVMDNLTFLESKNSQQTNQNQQPNNTNQSSQNKQKAHYNANTTNDNDIDISDDDLPF